MNKEQLNPNFDINAKIESMLNNAQGIITNHLLKGDKSIEAPDYINLAYDIKNYLQKVQNENQYQQQMLKEKNIAIDKLMQEIAKKNQQIKLLEHCLKTVNDFIESRKENMIPEHYDDLKYMIEHIQ